MKKECLQLKRKLATVAAILCLMSMIPLTAGAQNSVSTITFTENVTSSSTVYVGEVVVDGVSVIKYLYSGDIAINEVAVQNLQDALNGMADGDYAALLSGQMFDYSAGAKGFALCADAALAAAMDVNWNSAQYVGTLRYPGKTVASQINSNLYDIDNGFKAALDAQAETRAVEIETLADVEKCIVSHLDSHTETDVWYNIVDGQVIRHSDVNVIYDSEATTVIYTKVELETPEPLTFEAIGSNLMMKFSNPIGLYGLQYRTYTASTDTWSEWQDIPHTQSNYYCIVSGVGSKIQFKKENTDPMALNTTNYCNFSNYSGNSYIYGNIISLFNNETALVDTYACCKLFDGNKNIRNHPTKDLILGATMLSNCCYMYMFRGCTGLMRIPELPATTLANSCYYDMFRGCTALNTKPVLPATTLAYNCYRGMFAECTALTTPPDLPASTLAEGCYGAMFADCTNLQTAPELPATTLAEACYGSMFSGCPSLTTAPDLPATTLATDCYNNMFYGCTGLTAAPELPATVMANKCYYYMFTRCSNLETAPALPSTSLAYWCYNGMFSYCTSLTTAPDLPATTLAEGCYIWMFCECSNLNYVKCLAMNISADNCTLNWLTGVASTGTFVKAASMEDWEIGQNADEQYYGIPAGWTVQNDGEYIVTIPASGIGTFSASENVTVPAGLTAYYCTTYNSGPSTISVKAIGGSVIPAETGVLLRGTAGETYTLTATTDDVEAISGNALVAVTVPTHIETTDGNYTNFMLKSGEFIKIAESSTKMPANKAYLQIETTGLGSNSRGIVLDWGDGLAAIEVVREQQQQDAETVYDLQGRKITGHPSHGIYIINGKKNVIR